MRARLVLLTLVVVGAIVLWRLRPGVEEDRLLTVKEAEKRVDFTVGVPQVLPAGTVSEGVKVMVPVRIVSAVPRPGAIKRFRGLGIGLEKKGKALSVTFILNNSPAQKAGLRVGDQILRINGRSTASLPFVEALGILRKEGTVALEIKNSGGQRVLQLQQAEFDPRTQPDPVQPCVVFLYNRKGRKFMLTERKVKPGTVTHWAGRVLREVDLKGTKGKLRNINGHLTLTWMRDNVQYELNSYQDGLSAEELILMGQSIKEGGKKR